MMKKIIVHFVLCLLVSAATSHGATTWKWIAYGDTRTNDIEHRQVLDAIQNSSAGYAFIINVGDVVENGWNQTQWDTWQAACDDELGGTHQTQTPPAYMSAPGNHDDLGTGGLTNWNTYLFGQYQQYGNDGKYFVFDYANARFVVLNSEESLTSSQYTLLMQSIGNNPQEWLFVFWHRPIFDFGPKVYEAAIHSTWGVPLYQNGCDIIFTGHAHYYVRTEKLGLDGNPNPPLDATAGTVQIVTGNSGAPLYAVDENHDSNGYMVAYSFDEDQAAFHGYTELSVTGTSMVLRHIRVDGTVMDTTTYTANPKPPTFTVTPTPTLTSTPTSSAASTHVILPATDTPTPTNTYTPSHIPTSAVSPPPVDSRVTRVVLLSNPSRSMVKFVLPGNIIGKVDIGIFNITGEKIADLTHKKTVNSAEVLRWECEHVTSGIYFAVIKVDTVFKERLKFAIGKLR